ncbi:MAG: rRNA maturation RNase YbeY [Bacteroidota bacterium]
MIEFIYNTDWQVPQEEYYTHWLNRIIESEHHILGELTYQFETDERVLEVNREYLQHDYYTDIITFDYVQGNMVFGNVFVSVDRVVDNAKELGGVMEEEMRRVMAHGVLHLVGYKDKTPKESQVMREKENKYLKMFHVEQ